MMDTSVRLMVIYEDESVEVHYGNGSQLQLSPCGCEFLLMKPRDPSRHPLQPSEKVRQRTRFTISTYKEVMVAALAFRNRYARRPYLPQELIPAEHKKPFFTVDSAVQWPVLSSCEAELGPGGETVVRSEEGRAMLVLSPSGEDFSVEFTCSLSPTPSHPHAQQEAESPATGDQGRRRTRETARSRSCSPKSDNTAPSKPEEMYQSTTVIQHHSCCAVPPMWSYPLSLAHHHRTTHVSKSKDVKPDEASESCQTDRRADLSDASSEKRRTCLPQALPLTCPSPHWHRWKSKDPLAKMELSEQALPTEPVKVMWCQGVTYRILNVAVPVVEVSPGDGSVIRSNGVLNNYFTHHKSHKESGQVKEVTYHVSSLPPDVLGQTYSISSIVSRASRILTCYNQAKQWLSLPATPSCLQEIGHSSEPVLLETNLFPLSVEQCMSGKHTELSRSDIVCAELEKIKRFNFLLENSQLLRGEKGCADLQDLQEEAMTFQPVGESCVGDALLMTSRVIQDIDALISETMSQE